MNDVSAITSNFFTGGRDDYCMDPDIAQNLKLGDTATDPEMMVVFGARLRWVPISGDRTWQHFILPAVALAFYAIPSLMRLTRSGMLDVLGSDYIRTARAKGLGETKVVFKHALRNAVLPIVSLSAVQLGFILGGSVVIESIFSINGLGNLSWQSIKRADVEVMQAVVLVLSFIFVALTFLADVLNALLDPRIRV